MKATERMISRIRDYCTDGHGVSIFGDGSMFPAETRADWVGRIKKDGTREYRVLYVDDPSITLDELQKKLDNN